MDKELAKRDQGSQPTPKGFNYYRQKLAVPSVVQGSHKRGKILGRSEMYEEINKKLQDHMSSSFRGK